MHFTSFPTCLILAPLASAVPTDLTTVEDSSVLHKAINDIELPDLPEDWETAMKAYFKGRMALAKYI
ncbi:FAD binding domain protein [Colletotrichum tofieldiae]|nr:FAD binding domain protein [Colletotrichum tofieldiae]GKT79777.1 FAD binding domain protein [Colletotrichum tofieldiae]